MRRAHNIVVGDSGRIVLPAEVRERAGLSKGTPFVMLEVPSGLVLMTRDQLKSQLRAELEGVDLVADVLRDRRQAAVLEDEP